MGDNPKRLPQIIGAIAATMGGFSLGTVIGWSSPAKAPLETEFNMTQDQFGWISSIMPLGAASAQIYMAFTLDLFGRRLSMLIIAIPFVIGFLILALSNSFAMFCLGRFITGFCGGAFCVAAPTYIGEMAEKGIRGTLSVLFQLLLVIGIFLSYALGEFKDLYALTVPLLFGPSTLFGILLFLPESPVFLLKKGKTELAQKSLQFYRGKNYDISSEMKEIEEYSKIDTETFINRFKTRACIKGFLMLLGMHIVQQLSGINAVIFYAHDIFKQAGATMSDGVNAIILSLVQIVFTIVSAYMVDRVGRKILWILSLSIMAGCLVVMGIYFMMKRNNEETAKDIAWLPLIIICLYLAGFSLGAGPLPWVMIGEFLHSTVKGRLGSFITCFNWLLAFVVTKLFEPLVNKVGADVVYWFFAIICGLGLAYVILFVIETRNKTLEEIQIELGTPPQ
ncbi:hypothetical protein ILUMI_20949 [Ignelater luminosus]|uniref:Major facilitator superfamily (MFS) profile domain-containing protein n=1 Tax=Ignelater luminosus TaxID=2038154 RepID=A0A8K0CD60_IGNLU|nr:hypothetical protein ILUMI_20949 [Ignelater luminosus]